jgi:hypothetical protein
MVSTREGAKPRTTLASAAWRNFLFWRRKLRGKLHQSVMILLKSRRTHITNLPIGPWFSLPTTHTATILSVLLIFINRAGSILRHQHIQRITRRYETLEHRAYEPSWAHIGSRVSTTPVFRRLDIIRSTYRVKGKGVPLQANLHEKQACCTSTANQDIKQERYLRTEHGLV